MCMTYIRLTNYSRSRLMDVCHCLSCSPACAPPPSLWPCCPRHGAPVARLLLATSKLVLFISSVNQHEGWSRAHTNTHTHTKKKKRRLRTYACACMCMTYIELTE